jgi:miniconductance mechanosensitive channel
MPVCYLLELFKKFGFSVLVSEVISGFIMLVAIIVAGYVLMIVSRKYFLKWIKNVIEKSHNNLDDILLKYKVLEKMFLLIPVVFVYFSSGSLFLDTNQKLLYLVHLVCLLCIVIIVVMIINSLISAVGCVYEWMDSTGQMPIKSILQMIKILASIVAGIIIVSLLVQQSPWTLLKAMGAMTAVGMLVFKDPILGLVAGIQLSSQKMLRKGDWIEMSKFGANGDVVDVSLTTVKVQNFDKTIVSIPSYALVSNSFQNWRGMQDAGGRRIKRSINFDINSFKFLKKDDLEKLRKIESLTAYINEKERSVSEYNKKHNVGEDLINGRRLTNIGTYRYYIKQYLLDHVKIHNSMTFIVRQLQTTEKGLPVEIYVFTNDVNWSNYEEIQSDIFDHLLTVIPEFGLAIYQSPCGNDFKKILNV